MLRRSFLFALALSSLVLSADAEIIRREGKGYLEKLPSGQLVMHLKGSPYEMGFQHGKLLTKWIKKNLKTINRNGGKMSKSTEYRAYKAFRPLMHMSLRRHLPRRFVEEMRGLAKGAGVPFAEVEAANLFPEAFHCSGMALFGKATHDGSLYHVRILDYMTKLGFQDTSLVIVHEPDGYNKWINVGFAGITGTVTGMNEKQVSIGEMGGRGLLYWNGMPMTFLMRDALERASTLGEALEIFRTTKRTCEYYYVIADGKIPDARGVWATGKIFKTVKPGENFGFMRAEKPGPGAADKKAFLSSAKIDVCKHRILFKSKKDQIEGFIGRPPADTVIFSGYDRFEHFAKRLDAHYGKVNEKNLMQMIRRPVSMGSNLHNAIFHPRTLEVWVAVAGTDGTPACNRPYYRYRLIPRKAGKAKPESAKPTRR